MFSKVLFLKKECVFILLLVLIFGATTNVVYAQESESLLYVPLIGISSVPEPLALPDGAGHVTYHYAVKNFLQEVSLTDVQVVDDTCVSISYVEGDDNNNAELEYSETWRFRCETELSATTHSTVTATGIANHLTATHKAYATVVVGSNDVPPLVSIINITKVAYPLSLPTEGGDIVFTYKVNNPGTVPLSNVLVTDEKCPAMSGKLGDINYNNLLDVHEVWIYTCRTTLTQTTTNTVRVTAYANGFQANSEATITVHVAVPSGDLSQEVVPGLPDTAIKSMDYKMVVWSILLAILVILILYYFLTRNKKITKMKKKPISVLRMVFILFFVGMIGVGFSVLLLSMSNQDKLANTSPENLNAQILADALFGWKFPVVDFPSTGPEGQLAYSDIRDPGGIPQGLPVRLKIPLIGVDSAIEDAYITPEGRMDVPQGSKNVAWFSLGPHPGKEGSAVIGGHYGITDGVPFVFYQLDQMKVGDNVFIIDDNGDTLTFIVRSIRLFERDADTTTVFTSQDGLAHLNLITCEGIWNRVNDTYPLRRVVFTDFVPKELVMTPLITAPVPVVKPEPVEVPVLQPQKVVVKPELPYTAITKPEEVIKLIVPMEPEEVIQPIVPTEPAPSEKRTLLTDTLITAFLLIAIGFVGFIISKRR